MPILKPQIIHRSFSDFDELADAGKGWNLELCKLDAVRLNGTHKLLRGAQPGQIHVIDAANHWGFWHMGQFAGDYRKLFGETPSATLGCDAQPCKPTCPFRSQCLICRKV